MAFTPLTAEQIQQMLMNQLLSIKGAPVTDYNVGSAIRLLGEGQASMAEEYYRQLTEAIAEGMQSVMYNMLGFSPLPAVAAYGQVQITNSTSLPQTLSAGTLFAVPNSTLQFQLSATTTVPANGNILAVVTCTVPGSIGNVPAGTITQFVNPVNGLTVTNPNAFITGSDPETEDQRIARFQNEINRLHRGDKGAVEAGALTSRLYDQSGYIIEQVVKAKGIDGLLLSPPSTAPTLTAVSGSTSLAAGVYTIGYTYTTQNGETTLSPTATVTITAGQAIQVSAITLPNGATGVNYYMSIAAGSTTLAYVTNGTGAQTTLTTLPSSGSVSPPAFNTGIAPLGGAATVYVYNGSGPMSNALLQQTQNIINGYTDAQGIAHKGWKALGVPTTVYDSYRKGISVAMGIYPLPGYTLSQIQGALNLAIQDVFNNLDIGDPLRTSDLVFAARSVPGVGNATVTSPSADVPGVIGQIIVLSGTPTYTQLSY